MEQARQKKNPKFIYNNKTKPVYSYVYIELYKKRVT